MTARPRTKLSAPAAYLNRRGLIIGHALDYGCGHGFDCDSLGINGYDPNFPDRCVVDLTGSTYTTVLCIYVLNTIPDEASRNEIISHLFSLLKPGGNAYVAVRRDWADMKKHPDTQFYVQLDAHIEYENNRFCIYRFTN